MNMRAVEVLAVHS